MIPPKGFRSELYPLTHRVQYGFGLSAESSTQNSAMATLVRHTNDIINNTPQSITVNPHNAGYLTDAGPAVCKMSIIDKMRLSIHFNLTENASDIDNIQHIYFMWRPIAFSFPEKLDAADEDTTTTVKAILSLTPDSTFEDVVPLSATKLPVEGIGDLAQPVSTVNIAEVFGDYNMTTDTTFEAVAHDETLFQDAIMRYTNKGALKACVGRTRHVNLTRQKPFAKFYFDKFVPKSIRRVMPFTFMAILIHVPIGIDFAQDYFAPGITGSKAHVGVKILAKYHEWNHQHFQDASGAYVSG